VADLARVGLGRHKHIDPYMNATRWVRDIDRSTTILHSLGTVNAEAAHFTAAR
jgi:hypothetical protein